MSTPCDGDSHPQTITGLGMGVTTDNGVNHTTTERNHAMTAILDTPITDIDVTTTGTVNARCEPIYLKAEGFELTARQIVFCLAAHLREFGDIFTGPDIDAPLWAIDAHMRFDGDLTGWTRERTPAQVSLLLARAEQIARDYFGTHFPILPW